VKTRMDSITADKGQEFEGITRYRVVNWIIRRHWWFVGLVGLLILAFILFDSSSSQGGYLYAIEFFIFIIPLVVVGMLITLLLRENQRQRQTAKILAYKHRLSRELSEENDWESLVNHLARFPSTVAGIDKSCLLIYDSLSKQLTPVARWASSEEEFDRLCSVTVCQKYVEANAGSELGFGVCESDLSGGKAPIQPRVYCLPIRFGEGLLGVLQLRLAVGCILTQEQQDIFRNIGDVIGIALKIGQDRRVFYEMRTSETALAERRSVSDYLHDHLGQNLGYLHLKIDQLLSDKDRLSIERVFTDLEHMHHAADDAYEVLRNVLETIHPESTPLFTNLLLDHARKVSDRSNIDIDFVTTGNPSPMSVEIQHAIFYAFEELLSNAEKHSRATKMRILAEWGDGNFKLTISDNGVGFDPQSVNTDQHFGMEILNERMAKVNGRITLSTSRNFGTTIKIEVPNSGAGSMHQLTTGESRTSGFGT
jgi:signal transduction histidine kinase